MAENENKQLSSISNADTVEGIAEYWEEHSLADHWEETKEVTFEVRAKPRHRVTIDPELYAQVQKQAQQRGIQPETLVNLWISERIHEAVPTPA